MDSIESKGKTVDEAIFNGLNEMGVGIDEVDIEIVHEGSKGLFGLGKNAVVRMTVKKDEPVAFVPKEEQSEPDYQRKSRPQQDRGARDSRGDRGDRGGRDRDRSDRGDRGGRDRKPREYRDETPKSEEDLRVSETPQNESEEFLMGLFNLMGVDAGCYTLSEDDETIKIDLRGKDTAVLIGRRGDTLDALQYLTGLVINREREDYKKVMLDAENYRYKREVTLEKLAKRLANNVAKSGKPMALEPMNPYERRILHATLQNNPRVETYSEGEEPYRRVVIKRTKRQKRD